jgi:hypothetical protein
MFSLLFYFVFVFSFSVPDSASRRLSNTRRHRCFAQSKYARVRVCARLYLFYFYLYYFYFLFYFFIFLFFYFFVLLALVWLPTAFTAALLSLLCLLSSLSPLFSLAATLFPPLAAPADLFASRSPPHARSAADLRTKPVCV